MDKEGREKNDKAGKMEWGTQNLRFFGDLLRWQRRKGMTQEKAEMSSTNNNFIKENTTDF